MDLHFLHFPTSLQVKRLAPKGKKMRMDHPFILGFRQNVFFDIVFTIISLFVGLFSFLHRRVVQKIGSGTKMWDVGCDRMVFAINSNLFLVQFNSFFDKWSLNLGQTTINPINSLFMPH